MAADLSFDVIARDQASRVLDQVGDSAEQAGRTRGGTRQRAASPGHHPRTSRLLAVVPRRHPLLPINPRGGDDPPPLPPLTAPPCTRAG